jgi:putative transposase
LGGYVYHVLNRANGRLRLFRKDADFAAFEQVLAETHQRVPLRILAYAILQNHWHFVVWPRRGQGQQVAEFFRRLTVTHAQRWHAHHATSGTGHVYQGRFKSFPVATDEHLLSVLRYVERNPLRAGLVSRAEAWRWGSLWRRMHNDVEPAIVLTNSPIALGSDWTEEIKGTRVIFLTTLGASR